MSGIISIYVSKLYHNPVSLVHPQYHPLQSPPSRIPADIRFLRVARIALQGTTPHDSGFFSPASITPPVP